MSDSLTLPAMAMASRILRLSLPMWPSETAISSRLGDACMLPLILTLPDREDSLPWGWSSSLSKVLAPLLREVWG